MEAPEAPKFIECSPAPKLVWEALLKKYPKITEETPWFRLRRFYPVNSMRMLEGPCPRCTAARPRFRLGDPTDNMRAMFVMVRFEGIDFRRGKMMRTYWIGFCEECRGAFWTLSGSWYWPGGLAW